MLTRRENLLIRPWQQRRYNNHRRKVQSALPAIDVGPPPTRDHVCCKLKKLQWESERCARIEEDNFRLLQRMGSIMCKNRLDNHWVTTPPNFLQRVGIYQHASQDTSTVDEHTSHISVTPDELSIRKSRCLACSPHKARTTKPPREERVPWEPPRERVGRTLSATSISQPSNTYPSRRLSSESQYSHSNTVLLPSPQQLTLSRGSLKLAVNFPSPTSIKIHSGSQSRLLQREFCECKAIQPRK